MVRHLRPAERDEQAAEGEGRQGGDGQGQERQDDEVIDDDDDEEVLDQLLSSV